MLRLISRDGNLCDIGVEMPSEIQSNLFDKPISQEKGTGIGLNLCKQMLDEMGEYLKSR